jgi:hypothetical protein
MLNHHDGVNKWKKLSVYRLVEVYYTPSDQNVGTRDKT